MTDAPPTPRAAGPFSAWELGLAMRYLRAKRKEGGVALITIIAYVGITLAVAVLIGAMSIMAGFRADLLSRIVGFNGHIYVQGAPIEHGDREALLRRLTTVPDVMQVAPVTNNQALIQAGGQVQGVLVRGLMPKTLLETALIRDHVAPQSALASFGKGDYGGDSVLLGERLASELGVKPGDPITLVAPSGGATAFGSMPAQKTYVVGGTFSIGMAEYDQAFVFMPIEQAQLFFGQEGQWDKVEIKVRDPDHLDEAKAAIFRTAGRGALVTDWRDQNMTFFTALQVEHVAMRLILMMIVLIAGLNIISGLVMLVKNKGRDIAILRTIGASQGAILRVFFSAGASIGLAGTGTGMLIGVLFVTFIQPIQDFLEWITGTKLFPADVYFLSHIPARLEWSEVVIVVFWSLLVACLAAIWPAWRASRLDPVEALRYE